jgi:hypothetical protein
VIDLEDNIIRVKINSRHLSQTIYNSFIRYSSDENDNSPIKAWYCSCRAGARTVGCCAHIASILWFLGFARHKPEIFENHKSNLFKTFCLSADE